MWNSEPNLADDWEVEIGFKVCALRVISIYFLCFVWSNASQGVRRPLPWR
jgi:hypothetical protein